MVEAEAEIAAVIDPVTIRSMRAVAVAVADFFFRI
jgi:hypothetical protein